MREFFAEWCGQVAASVLPGLLVVGLFVMGPQQFLVLGPTGLGLAVLALVCGVALPVHTFRQLRLLTMDGEPWFEPSRDVPPVSRGAVRWNAWADDAEASNPGFRKDPWVAALEAALLQRSGRRAPCAEAPKAVPSSGWSGGGVSSSEREALGEAYSNLDLTLGVEIEQVGRSYRKLMSVFHPDRHRDDLVAQGMAEELARRLSASYTLIAASWRRR